MDNKKNIIKDEQDKLDGVLNIIDNKIMINKQISGQDEDKDINSYKKVDESQRIRNLDLQKELVEIKERPYFNKINIRYDDDDEIEKIYIGKKDIYNGNELIVASWASPINEIYNRFGIQKFKYDKEEESGKKLHISGEIFQKRKIDIRNSKVVDVVTMGKNDSENEMDRFVSKKIEESNSNKLGAIYETIQKDQDEIVRLPIEYNTLVQGCAGSGKSSVAFQRLAYLIYTYKLKKEDILVISPNNIFKDYTTNLMIELGNDYDVNQVTFIEYAKSILKSDFKHFNIKDNNEYSEINKFKNSDKFRLVLDRYIETLINDYLSKDSIVVDGYKLIDYEEVKEIWFDRFSTYKINERIEKVKLYLTTLLKEKSDKLYSQIENQYNSNVEYIVQYIRNKSEANLMLQNLKKEKELRLNRIKKQCSKFISIYLERFEKIDVIERYYELITNTNLQKKVCKSILNEDEIKLLETYSWKVEFERSDLVGALYLLINLYDNKNMYRHVIIDECQDLSYLEIAVIELITRTFTLVGDFNQSIDIFKDSVTYLELENLFKKYTYFNKYTLNKSFRNSKSITEFSNYIMMDYFMDKKDIPIAFARETRKPVVSIKSTYEQCIREIDLIINKEDKIEKNIAIICKSAAVMKEIKRIGFANCNDINYIEDEESKYKQGINVVLAHLSKGLEFDCVYIIDLQNYQECRQDIRLLYVVCTRALHELRLYSNTKAGIIDNLPEELYEKVETFEVSPVVVGLQNTILDVIVQNKGDVSQQLKEYISNIVDTQQLLKIIQDITVSRDVDIFLKSFGLSDNENTNVTENCTEMSEIICSYKAFVCETIKDKISLLDNNQNIEVAKYILENIDELKKYKRVTELAKEIGQSVTVINKTLMKLNLGTYSNLLKKLFRN